MQEKINHKERKESTLLWFIFSIIPIIHIYFIWKLAEFVSGHEKVVKEKYETLSHKKVSSTLGWFLLFESPVIICFIIVLTDAYYYYNPSQAEIPVLIAVLSIVALIPLGLYILWKAAEFVSGHEKVVKGKYEALEHKEKKDSTGLWLIIGIVPIVNLYFLWRLAETVSGHEKIFA